MDRAQTRADRPHGDPAAAGDMHRPANWAMQIQGGAPAVMRQDAARVTVPLLPDAASGSQNSCPCFLGTKASTTFTNEATSSISSQMLQNGDHKALTAVNAATNRTTHQWQD